MTRFLFTTFILTMCATSMLFPAILMANSSEVSLKTKEISLNTEQNSNVKPKKMTKEEEIASIKWTTNENFKPSGDKRAIKGGEIKWPITTYPATLRIFGPNANSVFNSLMEGMCYESLLSMHPVTLEWIPALADKWYIAPDNKTFYYHIDKDAKWSDGYPVLAEDVVESWKFLTNPDIKSPFENYYYTQIEKPIALSKRIVKIVSKDDSWRAFQRPSGMLILPAHIIKGKASTYIDDYQFAFMPGSGPYKFKSTIKGREITFERRKDYWGEKKKQNIGLNNFDTFKFTVISDESLMFEKFKKGDLDWYYVNVARRWKKECIPEKMEKMKKGWIQRRKIFTNKPAGISGLAFNMQKPPFNDIRVRKAFAYMFNREILIKELFFNEYLPINSYFPGGIYENPNNPKIKYDPDKAVKLLRAAGYDWNMSNGKLEKNGKPLEVVLMYASKSSERIWTVVQDYMKDIGITLKLKLVTYETQWKLVNEKKFKIFNAAWSSPLFPYPKSTWHSSSARKNNTTNVCGLEDKKVDKLIEAYEKERDPKKRVTLLKKLDARLMELQPYALGWYGPFNRILYWNKFGHPDFYLSRFGDYRSIASYWWIDPQKEKKLKEAIKNNTTLKSGKTNVTYWLDYNKKEQNKK